MSATADQVVDQPILLRDDSDGIATLTLNRPAQYNALSSAMLDELQSALDAIDRDDSVRVVIIAAAGKAFCPGHDLKEMRSSEERAFHQALFDKCANMMMTIHRLRQPVIAQVQGIATAAGCQLVAMCDIAVASEKATFGQTGVRVGSAPVLGGTNFLSMSVGEKRAKEIAFMCRRYPADEALRMGLINAVVPAEQLEEEVTRWADELLVMSPRYLEIAKVNSNVWWNQCRDNYLSGLGMLVQAIGSPDMIEGATAFMEKRKPRFEGRAPK